MAQPSPKWRLIRTGTRVVSLPYGKDGPTFSIMTVGLNKNSCFFALRERWPNLLPNGDWSKQEHVFLCLTGKMAQPSPKWRLVQTRTRVSLPNGKDGPTLSPMTVGPNKNTCFFVLRERWPNLLPNDGWDLFILKGQVSFSFGNMANTNYVHLWRM